VIVCSSRRWRVRHIC